MRNPFKTPLPSDVRSSEYGFPNETFDFPSTVDTGDPVYPDVTGIDGGVASYRGNTGELFQGTNPAYAGAYLPGFQNDPGTVFENTPIAPAPGSTDLIFPREAGGIPGTNRLINSEGPVTGDGSDHGRWTGNRAEANKPNVSYAGPVSGGPDYSQQLQAAYYAAQQAAYSEQAANSAMVSAV